MLSATTFEGTTDPTDAKTWLNLTEMCFKVMRRPKDRTLELVTFMF